MEKKTISAEEFSVELTPYFIYIKREEGGGKRVEGRGKRVEGRGWREDLVKKC